MSPLASQQKLDVSSTVGYKWSITDRRVRDAFAIKYWYPELDK